MEVIHDREFQQTVFSVSGDLSEGDSMVENDNKYQTLSHWNDSEVKQAIISFVNDVTDKNSPDYVQSSDRIAVFDHDGTLWLEKPVMTQIEFITTQFDSEGKPDGETSSETFLNKVKEKLEWTIKDLFEDIGGLTKEFLDGLSLEEYHDKVLNWLSQAKHPRFKRPYTELVYSPMMDVISLFQTNGFQCFIVSGGTTAFIRPWCQATYNIPTQNVLGSSLRTRLVEREGIMQLEYLPIPFYFDNGDAKVRAIGRIIGKQPIAAFGNTDGDIEMLRYTSQAKRSLTALIHHTDAEREYKYSPDSFHHLGESTLEMAKKYGWHVVDMKTHWRQIFES